MFIFRYCECPHFLVYCDTSITITAIVAVAIQIYLRLSLPFRYLINCRMNNRSIKMSRTDNKISAVLQPHSPYVAHITNPYSIKTHNYFASALLFIISAFLSD